MAGVGPIPVQEGNVLFNDALNTFYLWLYGVTHTLKDNYSDSNRGYDKESLGFANKILIYALFKILLNMKE